jgi:hypothetical protein
MYAKAMRLKKTILLLALMGCVHTESLKTESLKQVPPEQLVEHIEREESKIHSLKGQARWKLDSPEQKGVLEVLVAARHPDSVHLQLLDGLGRPVRIFVSHAGRFALWDIEKGTFYRGVATQDNLARFLPLYFSPKELVKVLLGAAPRLSGAKAQLEVAEGAEHLELLLTAENSSQRLRVQPKNFRVVESEVWGAQNYQLTFASFVRVGSQKVFPERRILRVLSSSLFLELSYTDYSADLSLDEKLFILAPPQGIRVVDVEEGVGLNGDK